MPEVLVGSREAQLVPRCLGLLVESLKAKKYFHVEQYPVQHRLGGPSRAESSGALLLLTVRLAF